jgi:hypothetical protein
MDNDWENEHDVQGMPLFTDYGSMTGLIVVVIGIVVAFVA